MSEGSSKSSMALIVLFMAVGVVLLSKACVRDADGANRCRGGTCSVTAQVKIVNKDDEPVKAEITAWSNDTWLPEEWMESPKEIPQDDRPIPTWAEATQNKATTFIDLCTKYKEHRANVMQNYRKMSVHYGLLPIDHPDKDKMYRRLLLQWMIINGKLNLDDVRLYPGSADKEARAKMKNFRHEDKGIGID